VDQIRGRTDSPHRVNAPRDRDRKQSPWWNTSALAALLDYGCHRYTRMAARAKSVSSDSAAHLGFEAQRWRTMAEVGMQNDEVIAPLIHPSSSALLWNFVLRA